MTSVLAKRLAKTPGQGLILSCALALLAGACGKDGGGNGSGGAGGSGSGGSTGGRGGSSASGGAGGGTTGGSGGSGGAQGGSGGSGGSAGSGGTQGGSGGSAGSGGAQGGTGGSAGSGGAQGGAGGAGGSGATDGPAPMPGSTTVVIFLIDGLQPDTARTAIAAGAMNLKFVVDNGVTVQTARSTSPAARTVLPPSNSLPWGNATSGNIAVHTGTHVYEAGAQGLEDIFTAAKAAGIKSVFSGGDANYMAFTTADFHYAAGVSDGQVVMQAINHIKADKVRLLRLHLQRIRDDWMGPGDKTNASSAYLRHVVASDAFLGQLIQTLKDEGMWNSTYLIVTADHGMGTTSASSHPASTASSWDIFMAFYGPDLKKGAIIPYAELPDVAVTAARFLGLPPLKGHTGNVTLAQKGPTGTVLTNLYQGAPETVDHPRYVDQYLKMGTFMNGGDSYPAYRTGMLNLIK
jgi:hypothetical protein